MRSKLAKEHFLSRSRRSLRKGAYIRRRGNSSIGFARAYGSNPYTGYDDVRSSPFLFRGQTEVAVFWAPGAASALERDSIPESRDIGATAVYRRSVDGRSLTFQTEGEGLFRDQETGTV